jgi:branched-chain amino acid transport system substrate-binding protein
MLVTATRLAIASTALVLFAASTSGALAQKKYDTGATDTEIKIGNIMPYSGPASAYGVIGKTEAAYFKKINDAGGINGRKINFISYDDGYSPPKTVEHQVERPQGFPLDHGLAAKLPERVPDLCEVPVEGKA